MKIHIYKRETLTPKNEDEKNDWLDILGMPSLKHGTATFTTDKVRVMNKTDLRKLRPVTARYYNIKKGYWQEGLLIPSTGEFAECHEMALYPQTK